MGNCHIGYLAHLCMFYVRNVRGGGGGGSVYTYYMANVGVVMCGIGGVVHHALLVACTIVGHMGCGP